MGRKIHPDAAQKRQIVRSRVRPRPGTFQVRGFLIEYFNSFVLVAKVKSVLVIMFVRDRVVSGSHFCFPRLVVFKKLLLICIFA